MSNYRIQYIDLLKGFLIICVVAGHIVQFYFYDSIHNHLFRIIYSFHMPLFMFLSGFVFYKPNLSFKAAMIKRRFIQLMLPFLVWSLVVRPLLAAKDLDLQRFVNIFLYPDTGYWFLWVLFFIYAIFIMVNKMALKCKLNQSLSLIFSAVGLFGLYLVTNFRYFGFQFIAWYFMFFTLGFLFRCHEEKLLKYLKICFAASLIVFPVLAWNWQMKVPPVIFSFTINSNLWLYVYKFVSVLVSVPFFMYLFGLLDGKLKFLSNTGKNTLGIYIIHSLLLGRVVNPVYQYILTHTTNSLILYIFLIVMTAVVITMCNILIYWIRKVMALKWLLLGEKDK